MIPFMIMDVFGRCMSENNLEILQNYKRKMKVKFEKPFNLKALLNM
jgi:hypothetical protein